jgi:aspartate-semialdehyde dehydrogenase
MSNGLKIGIVGATGLVGRELISIIERSGLGVDKFEVFASDRSSGTSISFRGDPILISQLSEDLALDLDYLFFCTRSEISAKFIPIFAERGIICIDNSSKFRLVDGVPLVIPEINLAALNDHKNIIANPNCSTIIALMALAPLHNAFGLRGFCVSTYQAVSGAGKNGVTSLIDDMNGDSELSMKIFGHQIALNVVPKIGEIDEIGYSTEEQKMCNESRKILAKNDLKVSAMCVRVPVMRAHSMSIFASFSVTPNLSEAKNILKENRYVDFHGEDSVPCPLDSGWNDFCSIGRLRPDSFVENGLSMWVVGDQIRKGAALNAFQIMLSTGQANVRQLRPLQTEITRKQAVNP